MPLYTKSETSRKNSRLFISPYHFHLSLVKLIIYVFFFKLNLKNFVFSLYFFGIGFRNDLNQEVGSKWNCMTARLIVRTPYIFKRHLLTSSYSSNYCKLSLLVVF